MFLCITQRKSVSVLCVVSWFFLHAEQESLLKHPRLKGRLCQTIYIYSLFVWRSREGDLLLSLRCNVGRCVAGTLAEFKQESKQSLSASQVVVFLLDVSVCVLEAERLDVVGEVSDASVEFLRSWRQGGVVVPAGESNRLSKSYLVLSVILLPLNVQVRMNLITTGGIHNDFSKTNQWNVVLCGTRGLSWACLCLKETEISTKT